MRGMDGGVEEDELEEDVEYDADKLHETQDLQPVSLNMDFLEGLGQKPEPEKELSAVEKLQKRVNDFTLFPEEKPPVNITIRGPQQQIPSPPYYDPNGWVDVYGNYHPGLSPQQRDFGSIQMHTSSGLLNPDWFEENSRVTHLQP